MDGFDMDALRGWLMVASPRAAEAWPTWLFWLGFEVRKEETRLRRGLLRGDAFAAAATALAAEAGPLSGAASLASARATPAAFEPSEMAMLGSLNGRLGQILSEKWDFQKTPGKARKGYCDVFALVVIR